MCFTHGTTSTSLAATFTSGPITITILKVKTTKLEKRMKKENSNSQRNIAISYNEVLLLIGG